MSLRSWIEAVKEYVALLCAVWAVSCGRVQRVAVCAKWKVWREPSGKIVIELLP